MKNSYSFVDEVRSSPYYNAFDPYEDFCQVNPFPQFLEEAKQHAQEAGLQLLEPEKENLQVKDKNSKKSWKASRIISWLKGGKLRAQPSTSLAVLKPKNLSVSGPVYSDYVKPKHQLSGQLNGLLTPVKKVETMM